ncbi:BRCA2 and CDKN1A-interacting protein [Pteropus alecto]|uniref:BRCA2 and CDKN1A-interacting protein n=1 Tax=Pteropus alecto TaxID=9402 RepID=L5KMN2_PTEAL|nr:BRCA2 and CDKN1A-interacting protein [Pteropus alecto]
MASRPKRRAVGAGAPPPPDTPVPHREEAEEDDLEEEDEDDEDSDEEESDDDEVVDEEVNVEFEAYSISDNDYDGIKKLLQQEMEMVVVLYPLQPPVSFLVTKFLGLVSILALLFSPLSSAAAPDFPCYH